MLATTGVDGGRARREPLKSEGSTRVLTVSSFRVRFDRFLLPATAIRQSVCLQPLTQPVETLADCKAGVFLEPAYDPVRREVIYRQRRSARLATDTTYKLTVLAPTAADSIDGFRAFDGAALAENLALEFVTVGADPPDAEPEAAELDRDSFCAPSPACEAACAASDEARACIAAGCDAADDACAARCLTDCARLCAPSARLATCALGGCHASRADRRSGAAMGLDLSTPEAIFRTAIGQVAHQAQLGEHAQQAESAPARFGRAMPLIDASNPGNSYLLYKLLIAPSYAVSELAPSEDELDRLRTSFVVGLPMPTAGGLPVPPHALVALSEWIAAGAPTHACE